LMFQLMESIKAFCIFIGPALACWIGASRIVDCMLVLQLWPASAPVAACGTDWWLDRAALFHGCRAHPSHRAAQCLSVDQ
jgi:hypothetical protein